MYDSNCHILHSLLFHHGWLRWSHKIGISVIYVRHDNVQCIRWKAGCYGLYSVYSVHCCFTLLLNMKFQVKCFVQDCTQVFNSSRSLNFITNIVILNCGSFLEWLRKANEINSVLCVFISSRFFFIHDLISRALSWTELIAAVSYSVLFVRHGHQHIHISQYNLYCLCHCRSI